MGVDLGEWLVGLRSNDAEIVDVLQRLFASVRVDGVDVFPNLAIRRGSESGLTRELHRLYRRGVTVRRTRSLSRVLRAAVAQLDAFTPSSDDLVRLRAELLVGERGAVVLSESFAAADVSERRLARLGWRRSDAVPLLDRRSLEVVIAEPRIPVDTSVLAEIDERWPGDPDEARPEAGRFPLRAVVLLGTRPDHLKVASPARRLASLASLVDTSTHHARAADVADLGRLDGRVEVVRALGFEASEVVDVLRSLGA